MRTSGPAVLLGVLLLLMLLALALGWPDTPMVATAPAPAPEPASTGSLSSGAPAPVRPDERPRPDLARTPLPPDVARLLGQAEAGDANAACRLGTRLGFCQGALHFTDETIEGLRQQEARFQAEGKLDQANQAATTLLYGTELRTLCEGIPEGLRARSSDLLRQAALAGEPEAVIRYARGAALIKPGTGTLGFLRDPAFDTWRAEAIPMLEAAMQAGRPEAVVALLEGYSQRGFFLMLVTPRDPVRAEAYRQLANRLFGAEPAIDAIEPLRADASQQREAAALAERWHREHFAGRRFALADHLAGFSQPGMGGDSDLWSASTDWKNPCQSSPEAGR